MRDLFNRRERAMTDPKLFRVAGLIGWPVFQSRSPMLHEDRLRKYGLPGAYVPMPVQPGRLEPALRGLAALGFAGCNVTLPHKQAAARLVDRVDPVAARMGAVNLIVVEPDLSLTGFNKDGYGFIESLRDGKPDWRGDAGPAVVLGAGGARAAWWSACSKRARRRSGSSTGPAPAPTPSRPSSAARSACWTGPSGRRRSPARPCW